MDYGRRPAERSVEPYHLAVALMLGLAVGCVIGWWLSEARVSCGRESMVLRSIIAEDARVLARQDAALRFLLQAVEGEQGDAGLVEILNRRKAQ